MLEIESLKILQCDTVTKDFVESLFKIGSRNVEELTLWSFDTPISKKKAVNLGKQFPNALKLTVICTKNRKAPEIVMAQNMKKLCKLALGVETDVYKSSDRLRLPTVRELHIKCCNISKNQLLPIFDITPNIKKLCVDGNRGLERTFLSFRRLITLECSIKSLIIPSTVKIILQRKPKLREIIAVEVNAHDTDAIDRLLEAYSGEFLNIKKNFEARTITLRD